MGYYPPHPLQNTWVYVQFDDGAEDRVPGEHVITAYRSTRTCCMLEHDPEGAPHHPQVTRVQVWHKGEEKGCAVLRVEVLD